MSKDEPNEGGSPWTLIWEALKLTYKYPKAMAFGASILLVGPKGCGKSSVFHYLRTNKLKPEGAHKSTTASEPGGWLPSFVGDQDNYLEVSSFVDTTGQDADTVGVDAIGMLKPSVIIVVLDGEAEHEKNRKYVEEFISKVLMTDERVRKHIKVIAIFLNKFDKSTNSTAFYDKVNSLVEQGNKTGGAILGNKCIACHTVLVDTKEFGASLAQKAFHEIKDALKNS